MVAMKESRKVEKETLNAMHKAAPLQNTMKIVSNCERTKSLQSQHCRLSCLRKGGIVGGLTELDLENSGLGNFDIETVSESVYESTQMDVSFEMHCRCIGQAWRRSSRM